MSHDGHRRSESSSGAVLAARPLGGLNASGTPQLGGRHGGLALRHRLAAHVASGTSNCCDA